MLSIFFSSQSVTKDEQGGELNDQGDQRAGRGQAVLDDSQALAKTASATSGHDNFVWSVSITRTRTNRQVCSGVTTINHHHSHQFQYELHRSRTATQSSRSHYHYHYECSAEDVMSIGCCDQKVQDAQRRFSSLQFRKNEQDTKPEFSVSKVSRDLRLVVLLISKSSSCKRTS